MDLRLGGRTAIVTGGSRGIGRAIATALALEGVDVAIFARHEGPLRAAATEISTATNRTVVPVVCDTGSTPSVDAAVDVAAATLGGVDILVNCAARPGGAPDRPGIENLPDADFLEQMNVKVLGYIRCVRAAVPHMKAGGWGRIVNVSGLAARQTGNPIGSMRNVAIQALTKNLADELGQFGITAVCVHPSLTWTEFIAETIAKEGRARGETPEQARDRWAQRNSIRRIIEPDDVANIVAFLASPLSVAVNGDVVAAGGGIGNAIYY